MAYIANTAKTAHGATALGGFVARISDRLARRRVYKRTYSELSNLSTRELDDLGISRSMITRLAFEAAYGS